MNFPVSSQLAGYWGSETHWARKFSRPSARGPVFPVGVSSEPTPSEVERTYMLVGRGDNVVRGASALRQRAPHRLDCGYVLARRWWRQGLMTEVLTEVVVWALSQPSVFRIGAVCDVENIAQSDDDGAFRSVDLLRTLSLGKWQSSTVGHGGLVAP